jgi:hypothetical protein
MKLSTNNLLFIWMIFFWLTVYHTGIVHIEDERVLVNFFQLICLGLIAFNTFPFLYASLIFFKGERPDFKLKLVVYRILIIFLSIVVFCMVSKLPEFIVL